MATHSFLIADPPRFDLNNRFNHNHRPPYNGLTAQGFVFANFQAFMQRINHARFIFTNFQASYNGLTTQGFVFANFQAFMQLINHASFIYKFSSLHTTD